MKKILKLALRSVVHFKSYTIINILGLALSLVCAIVIFRYVHSELNVDRFNSKLDRIYTTTLDGYNPSGKTAFAGVFNPGGESDLTKASGLETYSNVVRLVDQEIIYNDNFFSGVSAVVTDSNFLKIMDFKIKEGSLDYNIKNVTAISESLSKKIFGNESPINKVVRFNNWVGEDLELIVKAVYEEPNTKRSLNFDLMIFTPEASQRGMTQTLILLHPKVDYRKINKEYDSYFRMEYWNMDLRSQLYPLADVYFSEGIASADYTVGNYTYVVIMLVVGILLLLVGIVNFVNIYTAVILKRGKEFGMKKVFGANGKEVFAQLYFECFLMILIALTISLGLIELFTPIIKNRLLLDQVSDWRFDLLLYGGLLLLLPLVVSIYPFFKYNYSSPVKSLASVGRMGQSVIGRKVFLVLQYMVTIAMIVISMFFLKQLNYMLSADPGFKTKNIMIVSFFSSSNSDNIDSKKDELNNKLRTSPLFEKWCFGRPPYYKHSTTEGLYKFRRTDAPDDYKNVALLATSNEWFDIFGIRVKEGRAWDAETEGEAYNLIVSESTMKQYNLHNVGSDELQSKDPIWFRIENISFSNPPYRIVGVVKDMYVSHFAQNQYPVAMYYSEGVIAVGALPTDPLIVSVAEGRRQEAIDFLSKLHKEMIGGDFKYSFVEDDMLEMYRSDEQVASVYTLFTVIAIFVSALGLFSISLYEIQQRYTEIAIRKVNGAPVWGIVWMLLKKYLVLLAIGFVLAVPIAYLAIDRYLESFAVKAPLSWWLFGLAFLITSLISLLTLIYHTRRAANTDPARVLKSE